MTEREALLRKRAFGINSMKLCSTTFEMSLIMKALDQYFALHQFKAEV